MGNGANVGTAPMCVPQSSGVFVTLGHSRSANTLNSDLHTVSSSTMIVMGLATTWIHPVSYGASTSQIAELLFIVA